MGPAPLAADATLAQARRDARRCFGITRFRAGQEELIGAVLARRDAIGVLPTGAGKSLCYQVPALSRPRMTVVVSPLLALMRDQLDHLARAGIDAVKIDSTLSARALASATRRVREGAPKLVFVTPERLEKPAFVQALAEGGVDLFVVDEAHCVSQWGHDFRPAYLTLRDCLHALGRPPVLAVTATARAEVIEDIQRQLDLRSPVLVRTGIERANIFWEVRRTPTEARKQEELAALLRGEPGACVVYAATVKTATELADTLARLGIEARLYHGRLTKAEREDAQRAFMENEARVMVATNAFGLGIDKPDIRLVVHYQFPDSLESYYQEAGRAGRDGQSARAVLLYRLEDKRIQSYFLGGKYPTRDESRRLLRALDGRLRSASSYVSLATLAETAGLSEKRVKVIAAQLVGAGILRRTKRGVSRLRQVRDEAELDALLSEYEERHADDRERLEAMMRYAQATKCRAKILRAYFGEPEGEDGGNCDNCRAKREGGAQSDPPGVGEGAADHAGAGHHPLTTGAAVRHRIFGRGRVVERCSADDVVVVFRGCPEPRRVREEYVQLLPTRASLLAALEGLVAGVTS